MAIFCDACRPTSRMTRACGSETFDSGVQKGALVQFEIRRGLSPPTEGSQQEQDRSGLVGVVKLGHGIHHDADQVSPAAANDFINAEMARDPRPIILYGLSAGGMLGTSRNLFTPLGQTGPVPKKEPGDR